jgi:type IV secretory pathway TrbD component
VIGRISRFCTLNKILTDSPTLMSLLSGVNSVNLTLGVSEFVCIGIENTMIATATATARAATAITFQSNDQNDSVWYKRETCLFHIA